MRKSFFFCVVCCALLFSTAIQAQNSKYDNLNPPPEPEPTNQWAIQVKSNTDITALANTLQARNQGQIGVLENYYLLSFDLESINPVQVESLLRTQNAILWSEQQATHQYPHRLPNDPYLGSQWHLRNTGQSGASPGEDVNTSIVWDCYGITGTGVQIAIVDDGLEHSHPDLSPNYVAADSYDFNFNDPDPMPTTPHGTACAGVSAAKGNNGIGVAGAAHNANLSGLRLISGGATDAMEANALSFRNKFTTPGANWIYSNSWGPADGSAWYTDAGPLIKNTFQTLAPEGIMYVWAAGNGLGGNDNVNYDGYANSIYTIAVGAHGEAGTQSYYSEPGACMHISMPSNDGIGIVTTDMQGGNGYNSGPSGDNNYTSNFGGTSSACPLGAGVIALGLEANPNLGWRDMQYLLINAAEVVDAPDGDWTTNGANPARNVNHKYGFGRANAKDVVQWAWRWTNVPPKTTYNSGAITVNQAIPDGTAAAPGNYGAAVTSTHNVAQNIIMEHVEVKFLSNDHFYRGDIRVRITSPDGTESVLSESHNGDGTDGLDWTFMSVRHWGESSVGTWTISVDDGYQGDTGTFNEWELIIHGVPAADYCGDISIPNTLSANSISSSGAIINWAASGAANYEAQYRQIGTNTWTNAAAPIGNAIGLQALASCQDYEVRVRSVCANGNKTHYSETFYFSTEDVVLINTNFENGQGISTWTASNANLLCSYESCNDYCANSGEYFIYFGKNPGLESIERNLNIPACSSAELNFMFSAPSCAPFGSNIQVLVDGVSLWTENTGYANCDLPIYTQISVNLNAYADGNAHTIRFESNAGNSDFLIDDIKICAAACTGVELAPKVFLQGPLSGTTMNMDLNTAGLIPSTSPYVDTKSLSGSLPANAVDWVWVEIRSDNSATPSTVIGQSGIVLADGNVVDQNGNPLSYLVPSGQSWYIVIKHRNHLSIMSANPEVLN